MDLGISARVAPLLAEVRAFVENEVLPLEEEFIEQIGVGDRWQFTDRQLDIMGALKEKSRAMGLWNFFMTDG